MDPIPARPPTLAEIRQASLVIHTQVSQAREHVGAAGLEQTAALERMIAVSRGQAAVTRALEAFGHTLRADAPEDTEAQEAVIAELRVVSEEQLDAAHRLDEMIALALKAVTLTPIEQISAATLLEIGEQVQMQISALNAVIAGAQVGVHPRARAALEQVSEQVQAAQEQVEQAEIQGQVQALGALGKDTVTQIAHVEGASTQVQIDTLERVVEKAQQQVDELKRQEP